MLVYHVISDGEVGGAGIFLSHLLPSLASLGVSSKVILPKESKLTPVLREANIPLLFAGKRDTAFSLADLIGFFRILGKDAPDLAVSHGSFSVKAAAALRRIPLVTVKHCDLPVSHPHLYCRLTDATAATSLPCARHLAKQGVSPIACIENGTSPGSPPSAEERRAARAALGVSDETIAVGLCGRLSAVKGHETALRALSVLGEEGKPIRLLFLGEGEEEMPLRALASALGIKERVCFLGYAAETAPFYAALDVHLSCSVGSETSSLSLAEGMRAALPTVASATEGNLARVGDGGLFYPPGDATALASCLRALLDENERERWKRAAARRAAALPTWDETAKEYLSLFETIIERRKKKSRNGCNFDKSMLQ